MMELGDTQWHFPDPAESDSDDVIAVGADLEPATLVAAYSQGLFPMHLPDNGPLGWWSPGTRGVLDNMVISRSLVRSINRYTTTVDADFERIITTCADLPRPHGWITDEIRAAYVQLHRLGFAHSIETWFEGELVGGVYGVSIGGFFAGESMFHLRSDGSKVALARLHQIMKTVEGSLFDVQWSTPHLASLGVIEIDRMIYLARLKSALAQPVPSELTRPDTIVQDGIHTS